MSTILSSQEKKECAKKIWCDAGIGILFTLLMLVGKWGIEHTYLGEQFKIASYNFLQQRLISSSPEGRIPVAIVDISDLEIASINIDGETYRATPRDELLSLVKSIVDQEPIAIGIDIDFSPNEQGYVTPNDPKFFQDCLDLSKRTGIPIFLGIKRSQSYPSERWLGAANYKSLAATIFIPNKDGRKFWKWIKPDENSAPVPTMSAVLAEPLQYSQTKLPFWLHWAVEEFSEREIGPKYSVAEFLVDYSPLDTLENTRLIAKDPAGIKAQGHILKDTVVIVGDGTQGKATDTFSVPVRQQPVPGVYLHGCATYTLAKSALYELTGAGRWTIDILLSLVVLAAITGIRLYYSGKIASQVNTHWLQGFFTIIVVLVALLIGVVFIHMTRVMWDDFIFATAGLLLHPRVEQWVGAFWKFLKNDIIPIFTRRAFRNNNEGRQ